MHTSSARSGAMWVDAIRPHVGGLAAASVLSGAANLLFRSLPNSRKIVEGVPLYLFFVAMLFQLFVYPHFAWSAWRFTGYDERWFSQGWGSDLMGDAKQHERVWLYAMFGFMMKDMWIFRNDVLFFLHHGIALAGSWCSSPCPRDSGSFSWAAPSWRWVISPTTSSCCVGRIPVRT